MNGENALARNKIFGFQSRATDYGNARRVIRLSSSHTYSVALLCNKSVNDIRIENYPLASY
jgi:hypothetical protein